MILYRQVHGFLSKQDWLNENCSLFVDQGPLKPSYIFLLVGIDSASPKVDGGPALIMGMVDTP